MSLQNAVVFYSYGTACEWLARQDTTRTSHKAPLKLWQVYVAGNQAAPLQKRHICIQAKQMLNGYLTPFGNVPLCLTVCNVE